MKANSREDHSGVDDLRIQRAIHGLPPRQWQQLQKLCDSADSTSGDGGLSEAADFNEFDRCVAMVDLWLVANAPVLLNAPCRARLVEVLSKLDAPESSATRRTRLFSQYH